MTLDSGLCPRQQQVVPPRRFTLFQHLPAEIRHYVWYDALCDWAVWYTSHPHVNLHARGPGIRMRPVGAAPYQAGLACRESRALMQRLYTKLPCRASRDSLRGEERGGDAAVYWVIPDRTILYLGCPSRATDFLEIFHAHQSLPLRHLVLHWSDLVDLIRFSHSLAQRCTNLQTFIMHAADRKTTPDLCRCESPLSQGLADWYASIVAWDAGSKPPYMEHPDSALLHWSVGEYFGDRDEEFEGPKLHFLPAELKPAAFS